MRAHAHRRPSRGAAARVFIGATVAAILAFIIGYGLGTQSAREDAGPDQGAPVNTDEIIAAIDQRLEERFAELAADSGTTRDSASALTETDFMLISRAVRVAMRDELVQEAREERAAAIRDAAPGDRRTANRPAQQIPVDPEDGSAVESASNWVEEAPPQGPAPFEFDPPSLDFGYVSPGAIVEAPVTLTNTSRQPLVIAAMRASCQCTTLEDLSGRTIPPGESITFTPSMESPTALGPKNAAIRFIFEGYGRAEFPLRSISARAVYAEPAYLAALEQSQGTFTVTALDGEPFRVLSVNGEEPDFVDPASASSAEPRTEYELRWDLSEYDEETCADAQGDPMPHYWVVETDHPEAPVIDLRVRSMCALPDPIGDRRWIMSERRVLLDEFTVEEGGEFTVFMKWLADTPPQDTIRRIESESDDFHASLLGTVTKDGQQGFRVRIVPRPDFRGMLRGNVRFHAYKPGHSDVVTVIARVVDNDDADEENAETANSAD